MRVSPYVLLSLTSLFWSLNFIIGKLVVGVIPPITINFLRWGIPLVFYLLYSWKDIKENWKVYTNHWKLIIVLGLTGYCLNSIAVYEAVIYTSTINTSFINAFNPVLIALTGFILYRYSLSLGQVGGFILSLLGVIWIVFQGNPRLIRDLAINLGDLFMVGSIVFWSIHTVLYKRFAGSLPGKSLATMMMLGGVITTIPLMIIENGMLGLSWLSQIRLQHIIGIICLNIFPSVLAYRFWNQALHEVSVNKVAIFQYLIPVYTVIISMLFLQENLHFFQVTGGILIFIGVILVTNRGAKE